MIYEFKSRLVNIQLRLKQQFHNMNSLMSHLSSTVQCTLLRQLVSISLFCFALLFAYVLYIVDVRTCSSKKMYCLYMSLCIWKCLAWSDDEQNKKVGIFVYVFIFET
jgi:hypothetical protein